MSLYRTYRPKTFSEVIGQDHIVTTLEQALEQDKIAHAYLFAGPRGTGKTSIARILASHLLIRGVLDEALRKQIQKGVEEGAIVDLIEIDAASNRGIDDIRELVEKIQFSPVAGTAKVYIIDEVHMLTREAFNALLKTLEEPPPYAFFILATTELQKIPATIQSRCQRFSFRPIREEDLIRGLQTIADREHIEIDRLALRAIARHAQGGMRDAISLMDQLRSLPSITLEEIRKHIGEGADETIEQILESLDQGNQQQILDIIRLAEDTGFPLDVLARQLLSSLRTRLHEAIGQEQPSERHTRLLAAMLDTLRDMRSSPIPGLVLESALLSLAETAEPAKKSFFGRKKSETNREEDADETPKDAKKELEEETKEMIKKTKSDIEAPPATLENLHAAWQKIIDETTPPSVRMSLKNGQVCSVDDGKILINFQSSFHKDKVANAEASRRVEAVLERHFKRTIRIECTVNTGGAAINDEKPVDLANAVNEIF